jgi:ubiquinone/menaquinone biosynthesis C-methylase UbiE
MSAFFEIHKDNPREGPGDNASTRRAFAMLKDLPPQPRILDIGCGPGMQTLELARISDGHIIAVDNHQPFLDILHRRAQEAGLSDRIEVRVQTMFDLEFPSRSFDVIWAEGAIYIIGFKKGLEEWRDYLKPGGFLAVTEVSWLKPEPPPALKNFWDINYPDIKTPEENSRTIRDSGYIETGHFVLPESAWWEYYNPLLKRISMLRAKYAGNPEVLQELDAEQAEIAMYRKYHDYYGYVFYIMRNVA